MPELPPITTTVWPASRRDKFMPLPPPAFCRGGSWEPTSALRRDGSVAPVEVPGQRVLVVARPRRPTADQCFLRASRAGQGVHTAGIADPDLVGDVRRSP